MSCPAPPGEEHYPVQIEHNGVLVTICAKCQEILS